MTNKDCGIHLAEAIADRAELDAQIKRLKDELKDAPADKQSRIKELIRDTAEMHAQQSIKGTYNRLMDAVTTQQKVRRYTHDPISGKPYANRSDMILGRLNSLVGRDGVDTKLRSVKNSIIANHAQMEKLFGCYDNKTFKSMGDIFDGSVAEKELYIRVRDLEEEISPSSLTPERVVSLIKKYGQDDIGRLALAFQANNGFTRSVMAKNGIDVKYAKNYVMKRRYDFDRVAKLSPEEFSNFLIDKLDLEKTFGSSDREYASRQLAKVHKEMLENDPSKVSMSTADEFTSTGNTSVSRKFKFIDGQAEYEVFRELSTGGMVDQFLRNTRSSAATAVRVSEFGFNPKVVMENVEKELDKLMPASTSTKAQMLDSWRMNQIKRAQKELMGYNNVAKTGWTTFANTVRFTMAFGKLGNAIPTTMLDVLDNNRQVFFMNGEFFGGLLEYGANMKKVIVDMNKQQRIEFASSMGQMQSYVVNGEAMRMGDMVSGKGGIGNFLNKYGSKLMNWATLLPTQTSMSQVASMFTAGNKFGEMLAEFSMGNSSAYAKDFFSQYGFSSKELTLLSKIKKTETWGRPILTVSDVAQLFYEGPQKISAMLGVDEKSAGDALNNLIDKYARVIDDYTVRGTPTPELSARTVMMRNTDDEVLRAAISLGTQFMDTPIAQFQNGKELLEKLNRVHAGDTMALTRAIAGHGAVYLTAGISTYLATDMLFSMVMGKESRVDKFVKGDKAERMTILAQAAGRTSFVPFAAEVLADQFSGRYNKTGLDAFGSPALSTGRDVLRVLQPNSMGGLPLEKFLYKQLPTNALPVQFIKNWSERAGINTWEPTTKAPFSGF